MDLFSNNENQEALNRLIKIGEVSAVNHSEGTARVVFDDEDSIVSFDLRVIQPNTLDNQDFRMPDIGEDVLCVFLPNGTEDGFILGSFYAGEITPPESSADKRTVKFKDGTTISYDRATHTLTVDGATTVNVKGATTVNVEAGSITLKGDTTINGNLTVSGDVSSSGEVADSAGALSAVREHTNTHVHTGNLGNPTSPPTTTV